MGILLTKADLADEARFHTLPAPLVCFKPHVRTLVLPGHHAPVEIRVEGKDIHEIARRARQLQKQGVFPRITDGHVHLRPDSPEADQPALIGFASDPEVIDVEGEPQLAYKWHIKPEYRELLRHRPHRSAEYLPASREIRGIAALLRDPALDMGTLYYDRAGELIYLSGVDRMADALTQAVPHDADALGDDEKAAFEKCCRYMLKKYPALAAVLAAPAPAPEPAPGAAPPALYQQQVDVLTRQVKQLAEERDHEQCTLMVSQLIAERYQLNPAVEIDELKRRGPEERQARVDYIRQYYQQLPGGSPIPTLSGGVPYHLLPPSNPQHHGSLSRAQSEAALKYQADNHCTWEAAKRAVLEQKT